MNDTRKVMKYKYKCCSCSIEIESDNPILTLKTDEEMVAHNKKIPELLKEREESKKKKEDIYNKAIEDFKILLNKKREEVKEHNKNKNDVKGMWIFDEYGSGFRIHELVSKIDIYENNASARTKDIGICNAPNEIPKEKLSLEEASEISEVKTTYVECPICKSRTYI